MISKSHKSILNSQQNKENMLNVESEIFHNFNKDFSSSWILWQQQLPKKLAVKWLSGTEKKQLEGQVTTNWVDWKQVLNMIWGTVLGIQMDRGLVISE